MIKKRVYLAGLLLLTAIVVAWFVGAEYKKKQKAIAVCENNSQALGREAGEAGENSKPIIPPSCTDSKVLQARALSAWKKGYEAGIAPRLNSCLARAGESAQVAIGDADPVYPNKITYPKECEKSALIKKRYDRHHLHAFCSQVSAQLGTRDKQRGRAHKALFHPACTGGQVGQHEATIWQRQYDQAYERAHFQAFNSRPNIVFVYVDDLGWNEICLLYTSPSPRDRQKSRMPSSA